MTHAAEFTELNRKRVPRQYDLCGNSRTRQASPKCQTGLLQSLLRCFRTCAEIIPHQVAVKAARDCRDEWMTARDPL